MRKKYQIFISSTYTDLIVERQAAVEAVLMAGHIPAGMELFCAGDESQLEVVKRWIDESDIYCLILGVRYGSLEPKSGNSYTEVEYDYATSKGKPHFALVLSEKALALKAQTIDPGSTANQDQSKLVALRQKVLNKITRQVDDTKDIKLYTLEAISGLETRHQLGGWIRSNEAVDVAPLMQEIKRLGDERDRFSEQVRVLEASTPKIARSGKIAGLNATLSLDVTYTIKSLHGKKHEKVSTTWAALFALIGPKLLENPNDLVVLAEIPRRLLVGVSGMSVEQLESASLHQQDFDTIKIQLTALGLIQTQYLATVSKGMALFWVLTPKGQETLLELRAVKQQ